MQKTDKTVDAYSIDRKIAELVKAEAERRTAAEEKRYTKSEIVERALRKYLSRWYNMDTYKFKGK